MPTAASVSADSTGPRLPGLRVFVSYPRGGASHTWAERVHADLAERGATVWRDEQGIADGDGDWYARIRDALARADVVVGVFGADSPACRWQQREMLHADQLALPVVAFASAPVALPMYLIEKQPVPLLDAHAPAASFAALARAIADQATARQVASTTGPAPGQVQRQSELRWLQEQLNNALADHEALYEPLAAQQRAAPTPARLRRALRFDPQMVLQLFNADHPDAPPDPLPPYDDVLDAYRSLPQRRVPRLVVLGEPGAGKSFSLERISCHHARRAVQDPAAPLPLLLRLGLWTRADEPLKSFAERQLGDLGGHLGALRDQRRAVLLLDGLNEIPPPQRPAKAIQIRELADDRRWAGVVMSCRERDYGADFNLPFDQLTLQPLSPVQVHRCLRRAFVLAEGEHQGGEMAEQRFWQIAGGQPLRDVWAVWQAAGASFEQFWRADEVPKVAPDVYHKTSAEQDRLWQAARHSPRSLLRLAANPYLLSVMMVLPSIPPNRALLFDGFLSVLHARERQARDDRHEGRSVPELASWLIALSAWPKPYSTCKLLAGSAGSRARTVRQRWPLHCRARIGRPASGR